MSVSCNWKRLRSLPLRCASISDRRRGGKRHYLRFDLKTLRIATRRAREHTPEFKDKYRWRSGIESTFSGMDKQTGNKHLRVRGLDAVGYCARLKAIGVNLFRAARVKRALDALKPVPGAVSAVICSKWGISLAPVAPICCGSGGQGRECP